jgi:hypothetical protein
MGKTNQEIALVSYGAHKQENFQRILETIDPYFIDREPSTHLQLEEE